MHYYWMAGFTDSTTLMKINGELEYYGACSFSLHIILWHFHRGMHVKLVFWQLPLVVLYSQLQLSLTG